MSLLRSASTLLMPGETSQRAIEETLADWRQSRIDASGTGARVLIEIRGVVSLLRVTAMVTANQLRHRDVWDPFAWALAVAVVLGLGPAFSGFLLRLPASTDEVTWLTMLLAPGAIAALYPLVMAIGLGVKPDRPVPLAGQIVLSTLLVVLLTGWIVPAANEAFRIDVFEILSRTRAAGSAEFRPGPAGSSLLTLSLALTAPTFVMLGFAIRRRWMQGDSWRVAQFAAGAAVVLAMFCGRAFATLVPGSPRGTAQWLMLVVAWTITALALRRKRERATPGA